ncbi:YdcH family protein [Pseudoroseicyclus tamaricis]|uniref:DUF465 domain-containing protein n=1 Tax=Pseudoroseicyclus tamaricis TaxID=2705421 RepID=A0A6B2JI37_9RHOB|nr:DUF465 domain-containing protein [Pseudoroseicyclus tamaricis]NDV01011.1 DUF465 domain-containing protein [Pseudoroseicyclus tamaricis]
MSHVPHELHEDFPDDSDRIHELKQTDANFRKLAERYHEVNRAVHRAETDVEPMDDDELTVMRKHRMTLKDEIAQRLHQSA